MRGLGVRHLKNMRSLYEAWSQLETNLVISIAKTYDNSAIAIAELQDTAENGCKTIHLLQQTNYPELLKLVKLNVDSYLGTTLKTTQKDGTVNGTVNDTINDTINVLINANVLS